MPDVKCVLIHDNFQNFKSYNIPKAQLVIADIPYNIGTDFYASRPEYRIWGNGICLANAFFVLAGIAWCAGLEE